MRYHSNFSTETLSLEDYVRKMKPGQTKIYFVSGPNREAALSNPFMEVFKGSDVPVLILLN